MFNELHGAMPGANTPAPDTTAYAATKTALALAGYQLTRGHLINVGRITYHVSRFKLTRSYACWADVVGFLAALNSNAFLGSNPIRFTQPHPLQSENTNENA